MSRERAFIELLRGLAIDPAARGLADDCAVLPIGARDLVLTHDLLVEGIHFLPGDPPGDVAWKLVAVNLSDLAAKGARPIGMLLGYPLGPDAAWDAAFVAGLAEAMAAFDVALLGGDTVAAAGPRQFGLTAIGDVAAGAAPSRAGARAGDGLWVTGVIGAAGLGLKLARSSPAQTAGGWLRAYRRPLPRLAEGRALAPLVNAMCDVSDGLLIDAGRIAEASGLRVEIALDRVPLPDGIGPEPEASLAAATAGDDYELLFALPPELDPPAGIAATRIGHFAAGAGLALRWRGDPLALPDRLGYEH